MAMQVIRINDLVMVDLLGFNFSIVDALFTPVSVTQPAHS
jgi:hypothetical protein